MNGARDNVRNRLRFAGSRRSLDDEVPSPPDSLDHERLGAVRIHHVDKIGGLECLVELGTLSKKRRLRLKARNQKPAQKRMI